MAVKRWREQRPAGKRSVIDFLAEIHPERYGTAAFRREVDRAEQTRMARAKEMLDVLKDIHEQRAVLLVGAGFSIDNTANGLTGSRLHQEICERLGHAKPKDYRDALTKLSLGEVALELEKEQGDDSLQRAIVEAVRAQVPKGPLRQHQILARTNPFRFIVTTNWDRLIEQSYAATASSGERSRFRTIRADDDLPLLNLDQTNLIKIHGDMHETEERIDRLVITTEHFIEFEHQNPALLNLVKTLFLSHRLIILGFDPHDYTLGRLLQFVQRHVELPRQPVIVNPDGYATLGIPHWQPIQVKSDAQRFLGAVESYLDNDGRTSGHAMKHAKNRVGLARVWCKENCDVAEQLLKRFRSLQRAHVVTPNDGNAVRAVGRRAAVVLRDRVGEGASIAVSCGTALYETIGQIDGSSQRFNKTQIYSTNVPLTADCDHTSSAALVNYMAGKLARWGVEGHSYQLPPEALDELQNNGPLGTAIDNYLSRSAQADIIMLGIGSIRHGVATTLDTFAKSVFQQETRRRDDAPNKSDREREDVLKRYLSALIDKQGYVGDLMYRFVKAPGKERDRKTRIRNMFMDPDSIQRCLAENDTPVDSEAFRSFVLRLAGQVRSIEPVSLYEAAKDESRCVMIVAAGGYKARALEAVLDAGLCDTVVIDSELAEALLTKDD